MLCQLCRKNVALVKATAGRYMIEICIPCAINVMMRGEDIDLAMKERIRSVQEEEGQVEEASED